MLKTSALLLMVLHLAYANICPDGTRCAHHNTCCGTRTFGRFGCCPYTSAVCCEDKVHCCPSRHHCNVRTYRCVRADRPWESVPMLEKTESEVALVALVALDLPVMAAPLLAGEADDSSLGGQEEVETVQDETTVLQAMVEDELNGTVKWCDRRSYCRDGYTCCHTRLGQWRCCPYSPSKCCVSGRHCCPHGYDCNNAHTHCLRQGLNLKYPFTARLASTSIPAMRVSEPEDQDYGQEE